MIGIPDCDAYTATKGAIVQLTKSMAAEYGRYNIRVNCISPAAIMTPMMRQSNPENSTFDEERFLKLRTPLRRYGMPQEIAKVALFLASDEASYLNGAIIAADGGITINGDLSKIEWPYKKGTDRMIRKGFYMEVQPGKIAEYTRAHNPIPAELEAVMKKHGIHNYSIFHHPETNVLFGYMEIEDEEEAGKVADYPCARAWWKKMTGLLVCKNPGDEKAREDEMTRIFFME